MKRKKGPEIQINGCSCSAAIKAIGCHWKSRLANKAMSWLCGMPRHTCLGKSRLQIFPRGTKTNSTSHWGQRARKTTVISGQKLTLEVTMQSVKRQTYYYYIASHVGFYGSLPTFAIAFLTCRPSPPGTQPPPSPIQPRMNT